MFFTCYLCVRKTSSSNNKQTSKMERKKNYNLFWYLWVLFGKSEKFIFIVRSFILSSSLFLTSTPPHHLTAFSTSFFIFLHLLWSITKVLFIHSSPLLPLNKGMSIFFHLFLTFIQQHYIHDSHLSSPPTKQHNLFNFLSLSLSLITASTTSTTSCVFPQHWNGSWFQSTEQQPITFSGSVMSSRGRCIASDGDKYLLVNE